MNRRNAAKHYFQFTQGMSRAHLSVFAASSTFYLFMSLAPLASLLLNLLPYTQIKQEIILDALQAYAPAPFMELIGSIISEIYAGSTALVSVSFLLLLWSAAKFFSSIVHGVSEIYDGGHDKSFIRLRLIGVLYTVVLVVFVLLDFSIVMFGERLVGLIERKYPDFSGAWAFLLRFRSLIFIVLLTAYNALLFKVTPRTKLRFYRQLPGAAFSALCWFAFTKLYSLLIGRFGAFSIYGSLSFIVISMFWMYCSIFIVFLGAYCNVYLELQLTPRREAAQARRLREKAGGEQHDSVEDV